MLAERGSARPFSFVLSALKGGPAAPAVAPAAHSPRRLQAATPRKVVVPQIYATPTILMGLLLGLLLLTFTLIGLCCVMAVQTPDVMHSFTLPAGKEY